MRYRFMALLSVSVVMVLSPQASAQSASVRQSKPSKKFGLCGTSNICCDSCHFVGRTFSLSRIKLCHQSQQKYNNNNNNDNNNNNNSDDKSSRD